MNHATVLWTALGVAALLGAAEAAERQAARRQSNYPPVLPGADLAEIYKTVGDVKLKIYVYFPGDRRPERPAPGIVFFFGGGFRGGSPKQFEQHCEYFASRGMVAMTADYRVSSRHGTTPLESIKDGKSAIRWVRANAERLGVDPDRIVASGGSAGGLIAACCGVVPDLDEPGEDASTSNMANAMVLFNPAIMGKTVPVRPDRPLAMVKRIMPYYHVREGLPPTIMFFGEDDALLEGAKEFQQAAKAKGNRCELMTWPGVGHGFFNYGRSGNRYYVETVRAADRFLASLGYVHGPPTVK